MRRTHALGVSVAVMIALPAMLTRTVGAGGDDCTAFPCGHNGNKALVCHVPPGNPANQHTICISRNAVPAHLAHHPGDHCGECVAGGSPVFAGDVGGDGVVGVADLIQVVVSWGACPDPAEACPADLDADGTVGIQDLLTVVVNWD